MNNKEEHGNQGHSCGCGGHGHDHDHNHRGGCCGKNKKQGPITLSKEELEILLMLKEYQYLPVSEFVMSNSENDHVSFSALAPVYLTNKDDSMEMVKNTATILKSLEEKDLVSLDYDISLQGYDYAIHTESGLYQYFVQTVEEGKKQQEFLCNQAEIQLGSAALTPLGENAVKSITVES